MNPSLQVTPTTLTVTYDRRLLGVLVGVLMVLALLAILTLCAVAGPGGPTGSTGRLTPSPSPQRTPDACQTTHRCP